MLANPNLDHYVFNVYAMFCNSICKWCFSLLDIRSLWCVGLGSCPGITHNIMGHGHMVINMNMVLKKFPGHIIVLRKLGTRGILSDSCIYQVVHQAHGLNGDA